ncbi:MAG: hypothetical protein U5Q03_19725 [Bacteroidota bacterium]|nr:hypothetical protein [Bacteroidota bacterium]
MLNETKYIFLNTNSREFEFNGQVPGIKWLDEQLQPADDFNNAIVLFHVPPQSNDFDQQLKNTFYESLTKHQNVLMGIHGHLHHHDIYRPQEENQQLVFINIYAISYMKYNIIRIFKNEYSIDTLQI